MPIRLFIYTAILLGGATAPANAALTKVRQYRLRPPRDRSIAFAMAVTPSQDILSFIADLGGKWRLSRVRGWLDPAPTEERITVPGLVFRDRAERFSPWDVQLLLSPDGKLALCWAHDFRAREFGGEDEFVSLVDLEQFKLAASIHASQISQLTGDYRQYHFDRGGRLIVQSYTALPRRTGADFSFGHEVRLAILSLRDLTVSGECQYSEWSSGRPGREVRREGTENCSGLLNSIGAASLPELFSRFVDSEFEQNLHTDFASRPSTCSAFGYITSVSPDGRFKKEICQKSHRGFWGNIVITDSRENVYSVKTGALVGSIKDSTRASVLSEFGTAGGREYLLVMEGGTSLTVYIITE